MVKNNAVIWDWNGTLLNDIDICINSINVLLKRRNLPGLTRQKYKTIFTFPVQDYYKLAGFDFDKEAYDEVAMEFIEEYRRRVISCNLFPEVNHVLKQLQSEGFDQYIVSAMEQNFLMETVNSSGIIHYFEGISGITDHYASGKLEMARDFLESQRFDPADTWFIGDTIHDHEVASVLRMNCILIANGHQTEDRLMSTGSHVVSDLKEAVDCISRNCLEIKS